MSFLRELKRRNVFKVAVAYVIVAWLLLQVSDTLVPALHLPDWFHTGVAFLLFLGFPIALLFAWAFEITPEGLKKEKDVNRENSISPITGRKLDFAIIGLLAIALAYFAIDKFSAPAPLLTPPAQASIAVLPFADMSPESDQEYFSDGISEELLNLLVHVDGLKVASRTSSFSHKGDNLNISEIADELQVAHVLEGSVRKAGNRVRITAQLIDAATDRHLWSDTYDRELTDIFAIQDEIANAIVEALRMELGLLQNATRITARADTSNLDAYALYLEGRGLFIARQDLARSIELFEAALELDPGFARAWEGLGATFSVAEGWGVQGQDFDERALAAAQKAIDIDPSLSLAWGVLASETISIDADYVVGMSYHDQAVANGPKNATAWFWRGLAYARLGFADRAIEDISMCLEIDPAYLNCYRHLSRVYLAKGEIDKSLDIFRTNLEHGMSINDFWLIHPLLKRDQRMAASFLLISEADGDPDYPYSELLHAILNPAGDHSTAISKLEQWSLRTNRDPKWRTAEWIALGAYDRVVPVVDANVVWLESSTQFRASPYFKPLVVQMGWHAYWRENVFPPQCRAVNDDAFECD